MQKSMAVISEDFNIAEAGDAILRTLGELDADTKEGIATLMAIIGFLMDQGKMKVADNGIVRVEYTPVDKQEMPEPENTILH